MKFKKSPLSMSIMIYMLLAAWIVSVVLDTYTSIGTDPSVLTLGTVLLIVYDIRNRLP